MVRKLTAIFALVLALGMAIMPAAAQDVDMANASELGLESGYMRIYMADPGSASTPVANAASAATPDADLLGVMVAGFQFDSAENAESSFEQFSCGFAGGFMGAEDAQDCDGLSEAGLTVNDVDGMGDQAVEVTGTADIMGETPVTLLSIQSEDYLFMVITLGSDEPGSSDDIGSFLADAEKADTEVEFSDDGTSTGGFFDMLPQEGDDVLEGLTPVTDMDFFDGASGTPAS